VIALLNEATILANFEHEEMIVDQISSRFGIISLWMKTSAFSLVLHSLSYPTATNQPICTCSATLIPTASPLSELAVSLFPLILNSCHYRNVGQRNGWTRRKMPPSSLKYWALMPTG